MAGWRPSDISRNHGRVMRRTQWFMTISILLVIAGPVSADDRPARVRNSWDYQLEERLELRLDRAARSKRIGEYAMAWGTKTNDAKVDVVDGHRNPEAFLPFELFDSLVNKLESPEREAWWDRFNDLVRAGGFD